MNNKKDKLIQKLVSVAEMKEIEHEADQIGLSYAQMMENAGTNLAQLVEELYGSHKSSGILGLVGSGNNGGDTLVALAWLVQQGWKACAYLVRFRPASDPHLVQFIQSGGTVLKQDDDPDLSQINEALTNHAFLLDGILGTGFHLPINETLETFLTQINSTIQHLKPNLTVIAVDCPSGVDCDTGQVALQTIAADLTVTMAAFKQGLLKLPAFQYCGALKMEGIKLPDGGEGLSTWNSINRFVPATWQIKQWLPQRPLDAHKGTFGTALICAGSLNFTGAALLAGEAAYRIGAGLVTMAIPGSIHCSLAGQLPEATWLLLAEEMGSIHSDAAQIFREYASRSTAVLLGPGFGLEQTTRDFMARIFKQERSRSHMDMGFIQADKPSSHDRLAFPTTVIDADGLKLLAQIDNWHLNIPTLSILTPHPGEMSVLTGIPKETIQQDRVQTAQHFSKKWGHIVVLKGAFTVITSPTGEAAVIPVASPALARAGTGDVLAGLITGLCAQGVPGFQAAVCGAWIHAQAGLSAVELVGNPASVLARDILKAAICILNEFN